MNLPDLYARVVAKRPELAVKYLTPPIPGVRSHWLLPNFLADDTDGDSISAALILARWVEGLPVAYFVANTCSGFDVAVIDNYACVHWSDRPAYPTPIEALAAFYLDQG